MKPLFLCLLLATSALAATPPIKLTADLAGNGKSETYTLKIEQAAPDEDFAGGTLTAGKTSIDLGESFNGFSAELNVYPVSGDSKRQILVVSSTGASDWNIRLIFAIQGGALKQVGKIEGQGSMKVPGNSTLVAETWMGFWMKTEKYVFDKDLNLSVLPQEYYAVNTEGTVLKSFPVYQTRANNKVLANTRKSSKFQVLLWDPASRKLNPEDQSPDMDVEWYLIKTESGFVGWVTGKDLGYDNAELPWAG